MRKQAEFLGFRKDPNFPVPVKVFSSTTRPSPPCRTLDELGLAGSDKIQFLLHKVEQHRAARRSWLELDLEPLPPSIEAGSMTVVDAEWEELHDDEEDLVPYMEDIVEVDEFMKGLS